MTTRRTWLPQWTSRMRQLGEGGYGLVVGAGAEAVGAAGTVEAGDREGAGAGGAEEAAAAGVDAEQEPVRGPEETLS